MYKKSVINEINTILNKIQANNSQKLWWGSDLSSKNRFLSPLPKLFQAAVNNEQALVNRNRIVSTIKAEIVFWFNSFYSFRFYIKGVIARLLLGKAFTESEPVTIIKSFLFANKASEDFQDPYFGNLYKYSDGAVWTISLFENGFLKGLKRVKKFDLNILPLEYFLTAESYFLAWISFHFRKINIPDDLYFQGINVSSIIKKQLNTRNGIQFYQYLHYYCFKEVFKKYNVERFIYTHENNPWERMVLMAQKEVSSKTITIGYQHAVIPEASINMFQSQHDVDNGPQPDFVITTGEEPKKILEDYSAYPNEKIISACGLRYAHLENQEISVPKNKQFKLLLALEGIHEVHKMVDYTLDQVGNKSGIEIIIRTHPILPIEKISPLLKHKLNDIKNVKISHGKSLTEDIEASDAVMYWGTTVSLEALGMGRPVIHFDNCSLFSFDPLFRCTHLKWSVSAQDSLEKLIDEIRNLEQQTFEGEFRKAKEYISSYFSPITQHKIDLFFNLKK